MLVVAAATTVAAGLSAVVTASPAVAANCGRAVTLSNAERTQAQVDNCPANGADAWLWLYNGKTKTLAYSSATVTFGNGAQRTITNPTGDGKTSSQSFWGTGHISNVNLCFWDLWDSKRNTCESYSF
ncbi:MAG TPA: hypothetical protein VGD48_28800 [Kutzneria sp.]|jgi:hypothetical protein